MSQEAFRPLHDQEPTLEQIQRVSTEATLASMKIIRGYQLGFYAVGKSARKPADGTLLTRADLASEAAAREVLQRGLPGVPIRGEEMGGGKEPNGEHLLVVDPNDGTKPFVAGAPTSTVIVGSFNRLSQQVETVAIGQPATGVLWGTTGEGTYKQLYDVSTAQPVTKPVHVRVWDGRLDKKSLVFVDSSRGFTRSGRQIMNDNQAIRLHQVLQPSVDTQNYGSNGLHQALVANGGEYVAGSITTHLGGGWDVLGAKLVMEAGGSALGLQVTEDRTLEPVDPLKPFDYDMLITANNPESLAFLHDAVNRAWAI